MAASTLAGFARPAKPMSFALKRFGGSTALARFVQIKEAVADSYIASVMAVRSCFERLRSGM